MVRWILFILAISLVTRVLAHLATKPACVVGVSCPDLVACFFALKLIFCSRPAPPDQRVDVINYFDWLSRFWVWRDLDFPCLVSALNDVMMYLFTAVPHAHGHWQLQELRGNPYPIWIVLFLPYGLVVAIDRGSAHTCIFWALCPHALFPNKLCTHRQPLCLQKVNHVDA